VGDDVWNLVGSNCFLDNLAKLEVSFFIVDLDQSESALFVVKESEAFRSFDNVQDIHNTDWELEVSSDLIIDFKSCLLILGDDSDFFSVSGVSETVPESMKKLLDDD
jgi:hypothetical protein